MSKSITDTLSKADLAATAKTALDERDKLQAEITALREKLAATEASLAERGRMLETTHRVQRSYRAAVAAALAELRATVRFEAVSVEYPPDLVGEFLEKKQVLSDIDATIAKLGLAEQEQPK